MAEKRFGAKAAVFLAKFFLIYAVLQALILVAPLAPLESWIASTEAMALGLQAQGNLIFFNAHSFEIAGNCTGLVSISVLVAIVFSLRKPGLKKKAGLLALGALILFPLNLFRVYLVLLAAMAFGPETAAALHIATWFAMSAAILLLWYYSTKRLARVKEFGSLL